MTALTDRLDRAEAGLRSLETELYELRRLIRSEREETPPEPEPWVPLLPPRAETPPPCVAAPAPVAAPPREPFDLATFLNARTLAWTGGAVTLLGIVFFFVLAVNRGWIGADARVALGAIASAVVFGAGLWLRHRFGDTYASVAAVGAGIAGAYATLLAAVALYDLLSPAVALPVAALIAAAASVVALAWGSETLAAFGLLGAMLAPVPIAIQDHGLSAVGTAFGVAMLAAATPVVVTRGWRVLHVAAIVVTAPQMLLLAAEHHAFAPGLGVAFWIVYAAGSLCLALRSRLTTFPAYLLFFSALFAGACFALLFHGRSEGLALLGAGAAYTVASAVLYRRDRNSASLLWALGLALVAVAAADLTSGTTLTLVWSAEAAVLAWLARRLEEPRFQLAALTWLGLAAVHGVGVDAPPRSLFVDGLHPAHGIPSVAALAVAAAFVAFCTFDWAPRDEGRLARAIEDLRRAQPWLRLGALAAAGTLAVYGASLGLVVVPASWDWGHVAVAGLWSTVATGLVLTRYRAASLVAAAAAVLLVVVYDLHEIAEPQRWWSFAAVSAGTVLVSAVYELRSRSRRPEPPAVAALLVGVVLSTVADTGLLDGRPQGFGLLALAAAYGAIGVGVLPRRRDFASVLGIAALLLAVPASVELLSGTWLVLAWAATGAALAACARFEPRLEFAALAYLGLALVHTLVFEAAPSDLFLSQRHPGSGAPAVLLVLAGAAALAYLRTRIRGSLLWACGVLALYAATLGILEVFEDAGGGIDTAFQRGHTAVSTVWGIVGLALLYAGLKRGRALQLGGFVLFGFSLATLFLYDLSNLSSVARALSFLAVGGLLLAAGFFYQRLSTAQR